MKKTCILLMLGAIFMGGKAVAQDVALKTNLLYDATATINLGVEFGLCKQMSLDISGNFNDWKYSEQKQMKHWMVQPELRHWFCERFNGWFIGLHAHYAQYDWGGMAPWGISYDKMDNHRYDGWLVGGGISIGYQFILAKHWNLELSAGGGYAYMEYDRYTPHTNPMKDQDKHDKHYWGPTKATVSLMYVF